MAYLQHYGEDVNRRNIRFRRAAIPIVVLLMAGNILFFIFHNYRQERQVKHFFELLSARDYDAAYLLWVRTDSGHREYPMKFFMDDWGPGSGRINPQHVRITKSRSCGSGVILTIESGSSQRERLWVQRDSLVIGFPPPADRLPRVCNF